MPIDRSAIAWTDFSGGDANFILRGKLKGDCEVSPGCANCYACLIRKRNPSKAPDHTTFSEEKLLKLSRWKPPDGPYRRGPGAKPLVFVVDMGDLFHDLVPEVFVLKAIEVMSSRSDIDWQILTKRAERMAALLRGRVLPSNIWLGVTTEKQAMLDHRLPYLKKINAAIRFVSVEPQLEPVTMPLDGIHWVISGAESGSQRRPFDKSWARNLLSQCRDAGVPFFFKQGSARYPGRDDDLDGRFIKEWPMKHA